MGGVLLSHRPAPAVPSGLRGLTAVFGMGTGVTPSLWPPKVFSGWLVPRTCFGTELRDGDIRELLALCIENPFYGQAERAISTG